MSKYMQTDTLKLLYWTLFHSVISYGNIAWGGAYNNNLRLLQNRQNRILKIINKNKFMLENPFTLKQVFAYECLVYHYNSLANLYITSTSKTRNKYIQLPKSLKVVSEKNNYYKAVKVFNELTNDLKNFEVMNKANKRKLKTWILSNLPG